MTVRQIWAGGLIFVVVDYGLGAHPESFVFRDSEYEQVKAFVAWIRATVTLVTRGRVKLEWVKGDPL